MKSLIAIGLLVAATSAQAISFDLTSDHVTGGAGTPPFGTVTLTQNGTSVDFNVTLTAGYSFVLTGAADNQYFKFNAIGITTADITVTQNFTGFTLSAATGAFNGDGTGDFTFGITSNNGSGGSPPHYLGPLLFSVANSTISDFTTANADGNIFVADILAPNGNTGPVDASIPEPSAMLLVPLGAIVGFVLRFRLKR
jgi:hypothetical protein